MCANPDNFRFVSKPLCTTEPSRYGAPTILSCCLIIPPPGAHASLLSVNRRSILFSANLAFYVILELFRSYTYFVPVFIIMAAKDYYLATHKRVSQMVNTNRISAMYKRMYKM